MTKLKLIALILIASLPSLAFGDIHIKYLYPDGSLKTIYEFTPVSPQDDINHAISESVSENTGGPFHIIIGTDLDRNPTSQTYSIVASAGVLICQNVLDPTGQGD